jgi:cell wall-associated NlpC family hydrolase
MSDSATSPKFSIGDRIAAAAIVVWQTKQAATYASPPTSDQAFDCSYFVWLSIKAVNNLFKRESSASIVSDRLQFQPVSGPTQAGDVVYFPPGPVPYEVKKGNNRVFPGHVAIILSANQFVGMQSNGVGKVMVPDLWWWGRPKQFFRYVGPVQ